MCVCFVFDDLTRKLWLNQSSVALSHKPSSIITLFINLNFWNSWVFRHSDHLHFTQVFVWKLDCFDVFESFLKIQPDRLSFTWASLCADLYIMTMCTCGSATMYLNFTWPSSKRSFSALCLSAAWCSSSFQLPVFRDLSRLCRTRELDMREKPNRV